MENSNSSSRKSVRKPIRCKAAVCRKAGEPLVMEEIVVAPPEAYEVRIRIICTSLCHTDLTCWKMEGPPGYFPTIFGHEAIGVVESVGDNVNAFAEGEMVLPVLLPECGECRDCRSSKSNLCTNIPFSISPWMPRYKESSRFTDADGQTLYHFLNVSSFSEYTVVDVANVVKIDSSVVSPSRACLLSCGVSTGVGAAWKTAEVEAGSTVAIFGLGSIGLAVAEGARMCGASRIIGIDINPEKFEISKNFGVTDFINSNDCGNKPVSEVISEMTDGGADYCFECVGSVSVVQQAYASCRQGWGKTVMIGLPANVESQICLDPLDVLMKGKNLMGSLFGNLKAKIDIPLLLKRYVDKEFDLDKFVTHEMKIEDINKAFELLLSGKCIRCVMWMDK